MANPSGTSSVGAASIIVTDTAITAVPTVRTVTAVPAYPAGSDYIIQGTAATNNTATSAPSKQGFAARPTGTRHGTIAAIVIITVVLVMALVSSPFLFRCCLRRKRLKQAQRGHRISTLQRVEDRKGEDTTPELNTDAPVPRELPAPGLAFHLSHEVKEPPEKEPVELDAGPIPALQRTVVSPTATLKADVHPLRPSYVPHGPSQYDGSSLSSSSSSFFPVVEITPMPSPQPPQRSSPLESLRRRLSPNPNPSRPGSR